MNHFYDGQIRRYLTQMIRMFSNFSVREGDGRLKQVPVLYGDLTRQVAAIIKENSENKLPSVPRMSLYITALEIDRDRTSDSSFVSKLHIRERAVNAEGTEYLNTQGKNYTVERLMPTPYKLSINLDIWTSNTDQKLQIIEQFGMLFNPSLELQTTDNYVDWASLTTVELTNINFSSRSIPVGTESEIDIATLSFVSPIYISPPAKVKRLGVITKIITSVFNEATGTIELGLSAAQASAGLYDSTDFVVEDTRKVVDRDGNDESVVDYGQFTNLGNGELDIDVTRKLRSTTNSDVVIRTTWLNLGVFISDNKAMIIDNNVVGNFAWRDYFDAVPGCYSANSTQITITLSDETILFGTVTINPANEKELLITWDIDTFPQDTIINGRTNIDFIIDPLRWNPDQAKLPGLRLLILGDIGSTENAPGTGADAWKNSDGSDFVASENDIIEWNGTRWEIVFDASSSTNDVIYTSNLNTGTQYRWTGEYWTKSIDGEYPSIAWGFIPAG